MNFNSRIHLLGFLVFFSCQGSKDRPVKMQNEHGTKVAAHRGANEFAPENTLAAFKKAIDLGVDYIEIDVRQSLDGQMVVIHDRNLERTTNGKGYVDELEWKDLRLLSAGGWFDSKYVDQKIPRLDDLCAFISEYSLRVGSDVKLYVDCKDISPYNMIAILRDKQLLDRAIFYGSVSVLSEIKDVFPNARVLVGLSNEEEIEPLFKKLNPYAFDVKWELLSEELIKKIHERKAYVFSDGIGNGKEAISSYRKAMEMRIDVIQTDRILHFFSAKKMNSESIQ
ncbi:glycerophosphodiester phosphodiesterase [Membranihabitans maritimus]|uniref:glycerophosphodiester phosphodiesterase n=1 Tax=Membranihabitans maritimus TaxID=2904244 RepID=UPI001F4582F2|nr:glycerophosphodiester phosphodiesterase family protein [Membranihabitans maritimus]